MLALGLWASTAAAGELVVPTRLFSSTTEDGFSFWVDQRGEYSVESVPVFDDFPGRLALFRGPYDPSDPGRGLIAVADYAGDGSGASLDAVLEEGVIYYALTSWVDAADTVPTTDYRVTVSGPGEPRPSACFAPGDEAPSDLGEALWLSDGFCVEVEWATVLGTSGIGTTVPYRSDDSGMFWFFNPDNWEVLVKVLDGCAVNGHYWVFFAATTDVELDLYVDPLHGPYRGGNAYHNDQSTPADAVTDTAAFPCDEL